MRDILFRGKRVDNGEWVFGGYAKCNNRHYILPDIDLIGKEWVFKNVEVIPETVGQFTGLADKNGKKIFEGDIVNYTGMPKIYMIDFHEEFLHCSLFYYDKELKNIYYCGIVHKNDGESIEVIGTIYDNPELLEVKE